MINSAGLPASARQVVDPVATGGLNHQAEFFLAGEVNLQRALHDLVFGNLSQPCQFLADGGF